MAQQGYGPPSLPVGTEVSAKYRGAFCEAKVKTVSKIVKCKIQMKDSSVSFVVAEEEIKGIVKVGTVVEVKHPHTGQLADATIHKLFDHSLYTVVFDDGDERTLRRSQLCLKGDKHFIESETLDNLPLSHPEHFGTPVLHNKKGRRKADNDNDGDDSEQESPRRAMYRGRHQELVGKLFLVDQRKGSAIPHLVVLPDSNSISELKRSDHILVRSFKDSRYSTVTRKQLKEFSRSAAIKNEDKTMRTAFEKALLYFDTKELPVGWKRDDMLGSDIEDDDVVEDNEYASEDEPFEEKDRFVAQLYKFMDERGTPINKGPCIGNKDLNLYKLFKIVQNIGGYNKVTKEMKWHVVYSKMGLPSMHQNPAHQVKIAYKKYLDAYETFYRKLGNSMGTHSRPGRARQNSGRSILNYRSRDKSPRLPKPALEKKEVQETPKLKIEAPEKSEDSQDSASVASTEENDVAPRRTMQRRDRVQATKEKERDDSKEKKDETGTKGKNKKDDVKAKKEDVISTSTVKTKKEDTVATSAVKTKKEDAAPTSAVKTKKEDAVPTSAAKTKKEDAVPTSAAKTKKEDMATPVSKGKKEDAASKAKVQESVVKKEERKSVRKQPKAEEVQEKDDKSEAKPARAVKKEKGETPAADSIKKRLTRRKLLKSDKDEEAKEDESKEEKNDPLKKASGLKDLRTPILDKMEKVIPRTLERRDSKTSEKKSVAVKATDVKVSDKKAVLKSVEDKKVVKREKKAKEAEKEEDASEGEEEVEVSEDQKQEKISFPKIEYPIGTKVRVKYGKGKNQKMYIAKVVETVVEGPHRTYLVHYAGWNIRYDEWIRGERVTSVLDKAACMDRQPNEPPKRLDSVKGGLKVHKPLSSSLKRLTTPHRMPMLAKKPNQVFITPKVISAKTRATRSSSSETSGTLNSDKRATRRRSIVSESSSEKGEETQQTDEVEVVSTVEEKYAVETKENAEEETQLVDVEDEEGQEEEGDDDNLTDKNEMDTSIEEEEEMLEDEEKVKPETLEERKKEQVKDESEEDSEVKEEDKDESESVEEDVQEENSVEEESGDQEKEDISSPVRGKVEKASVMVAEVRTADSEITSALEEEDVKEQDKKDVGDVKPEISCTSSSGSGFSSQESEKEEKEDEEEEEEAVNDKDGDSVSLEIDLKKEESESNSEGKKLDEQDEEEESSDRSIPLLKKMEVVEERRDVDKTKGRGRKKESGKDTKKLGKSFSSDASNNSAEIPTLEPINVTPDPAAVKSSPSPYDFDEAEAESQWQPEISKKWDTGITEQSSRSKESTPIAGDNMMEKEKKKTKKKLSSPQFVSDSRSDDASSSSQPIVDKNVSLTAECSVNEDDRLSEKQGQKKKGRKRKEVSIEQQPRPDVIEQYESTVNSVVEAVKHSLREESSEREISKPTPKRRRLKRVSESDKRDVGRGMKVERRRGGLRDSQDTVEALNVEGSKGKVVVRNESLLDNVRMLTMPNLKQSVSESVKKSSDTVDTKTEARVSRSETDNNEADATSGTQPFVPQLSGEERMSSGAHYENTPPTTPEHDEGEGCAAASSQQQNGSISSCSDDLAMKTDSTKDGSLSSSSSISLPVSSSNVAPAKSNSDSPSDNDVGSTTSNDNMDTALATNQGSESSGTEQEVVQSRKRKPLEEPTVSSAAKKKKRVHGTRSRTAKKSPKYVSTDSAAYQTRISSDSHLQPSTSSSQYMESPLSRLADLTKSPRPSKYNFNSDLGEYLEGEERCHFLIGKMKEIKTVYMNLKSEVASIDRRRKRIRRKERESSQTSPSERDSVR